jgi:membrane-associated phospholipid phosphatase
VTRLPRGSFPPAQLALAALAWFGLMLGTAILCGKLLALAETPNGATGLDSSITSWVVAHRTDGLTTLARLFSTVGGQTVLAPLTGLVVIALIARRRIVLAVMLAAAWGGALGLYNLTKHFVARPRPPAHLGLTKAGATSFPSGHATQSLATFFALAAVAATFAGRARGPARALALILAAGVGCSRVYLGVHWSTDVIAGWLLAAAWIAGLLWLARLAMSPAPRHRGQGGD